jgi:hypothetical protein
MRGLQNRLAEVFKAIMRHCAHPHASTPARKHHLWSLGGSSCGLLRGMVGLLRGGLVCGRVVGLFAVGGPVAC